MKFVDALRTGYQAYKARMTFPTHYGGSYGWWAEFFQTFRRTKINYAQEAGDLNSLRQSSLVMTAVNWFGRRFPEAPPGVFKVDSAGKWVEDPKHDLTKLLRRANPFFTGKTISKAAGLNWIIDGNVFWRIESSRREKPVQIWPIPFWMMEPRWNKSNPSEFIGWYDYIIDGKVVEQIDPSEIIHFRDGINPINQRRGLSPLGSLLREIYTDSEVGNFSAQLMTNSGVPEFILVPQDTAGMTTTDYEALRDQFEARRSGDNRGKSILATKAMKIERMTFEPEKLDLSALRDIPESRLAAVIGIPASALGLNVGIKNNTYSNAKELGEDATEGYLVPLWDYWGEELTFHFQNMGVLGEDELIRYKLTEVRALQEDKSDQFQRNSEAYQGGWMKRSEARAEAGLPVEKEDEVYITDVQAARDAANAERQAEFMQRRANDPLNQDRSKEEVDKEKEKEKENEKKKSIYYPTAAEIERMKRSWRDRVPGKAAGLIDARPNGRH